MRDKIIEELVENATVERMDDCYLLCLKQFDEYSTGETIEAAKEELIDRLKLEKELLNNLPDENLGCGGLGRKRILNG